jgi:hypothetical protein
MEGRTLLRLPSNRAYSSRTSCSRGERDSLASRLDVEAERWSGASDAMALSFSTTYCRFPPRCRRCWVLVEELGRSGVDVVGLRW